MSQAGIINVGGSNPFGPLTITSVVGSVTPVYTVVATDQYIDVTSDAPVQIILPAATVVGRLLIIKDKSGTATKNHISVTAGGVTTIDLQTTYVMAGNFDAISLIYDGANYEIW